jgi:arsenate reductase (thioredoxin)
MLKIMFLCTGNSCRSQMAEGLGRELGKGLVEVYSAGVAPAGRVNPHAIIAMKEFGIDISNQTSKPIDETFLKTMDIIITLCSDAEASCPKTPPEIKRLHWPINDPIRVTGTNEEVMNAFRTAREEIKKRIAGFIEDMQHEPEATKGTDAGLMRTFKISNGPDDEKNG